MAEKLPVDKRTLLDTLTEVVDNIKPHLVEVAEQTARNVVYRVLDLEDTDLRQRIRAQIRQLVEEEVGNHLKIDLTWKA